MYKQFSYIPPLSASEGYVIKKKKNIYTLTPNKIKEKNWIKSWHRIDYFGDIKGNKYYY